VEEEAFVQQQLQPALSELRDQQNKNHTTVNLRRNKRKGMSPPIPKCSGHLKVNHKRLHHARRSHDVM
jgi:hypothetical protein